MNKLRGFTLLEILIALSVFAILATITSSVLYYAFNSRARVNQQADRLNTLQSSLILIQRDSTQALPRAVRGDEMHLFPAFIGQPQYFELTKLGLANPLAQDKRSHLQRVAYLCRDGMLLRRSWLVLDAVHRREQFEEKILLNNLTACHFAYLNQTLQVLPEWRENALQQNQRAEPLPKAIQFNLNLRDWGELIFLSVIPGAVYVEQ
ncbi:GspJ family T2SS minor pseudopilin variant LspJ [Legionella jordanis]|uniref:Type II secretion system protein J n=1 Tax=Legionella jordanis TaxID=456 RepID=A0A0W0V7K2_9GAMM|nr:GspJ family T2SS minor pseudopilin variant LspJ [Legionella jordanis]KTD16108.1 type II secretory pathway protein LspJ [Legionella jordanis]RMX04661.1 type II secretion system protein GspJ [Legionella jordanis]RMX18371.1 type II secretion system protein GspJ [Legionella jordanis]VEH12432.1 general secretion pathway protein J [Legionella jordanis]HAT8713943.1 type II secretion system protein GspJ [Legionella jordanis]